MDFSVRRISKITNEAYVSIQRWAYVAGPTAAQALRNLADYLERLLENDVNEAVNGLDDNIVPVMLLARHG